MSLWLTADELNAASGRKRASAQLAWALDRGFVADARMTDADGRPLVLRSLFEPVSAQSQKARPNFEALHGT